MGWVKEVSIIGGVTGVVSLVLSIMCGWILLPILRHYKLGQPIKAEGMAFHKSKEGTPTMGGLSFVLPFLLCCAGFAMYTAVTDETNTLIPFALTVLFAFGNSAIGFIDDYCKLIRKSNDGLNEWQKFVLQVVLCGAYLAMMRATGHFETAIHIPFFDTYWELSWFAYPLYLLVMVGFINATNLTDGVDGLASSICAVVCAFGVLYCAIRGNSSVCVLFAALLGGMLAFLVFNHNPAQMFMGDTGSLFLGGVIIGGAVMTNELLLFVMAGFVFVMDMLTSLLQRMYFKLTHGKRIFPIAPIHHSFQKAWKWSENQIVALFAGVTVLLCVLAYFGI